MEKPSLVGATIEEIRVIVNDFLILIGQFFLQSCQDVGDVGVFAIETFKTASKKLDLNKTVEQMAVIGVNSLSVVTLTGISIGAVLVQQSHSAFSIFSVQDQYVGPLIYLSMAREFGPIVSAIMIIARAGSAMTAELGSMKISEQVDALKTLSIDPFGYLVAPRVIGATLIMPFLSMFCTLSGITAGYIMAVWVLNVNPECYADSIRKMLVFKDFGYGLIKAAVFGFLASLICCYKGMITTGGSKGVGQSTTQAVVYSCVTIFFANYILTSLLFHSK